MHRGYVKEWRKELESDIWHMPPLYHRAWSWLRKVVNHEPKLVPTPRGPGIWILPGQKITSLGQIADGISYVENSKRVVPDKRTINRILEWLEYNRCITVTSNAHGTLISIINWGIYNGASPLQATDDVPPSPRPMYTNKNDKNEKKEKNMCHEGMFETFWEALPSRAKRCGKKPALASWNKNVNGNAAEVIESVKLHAQSEDWLKDGGAFIPMITTWLNQHRWTAPADSLTIKQPTLGLGAYR